MRAGNKEIAATRKMYSACGKDPSRYRPSGPDNLPGVMDYALELLGKYAMAKILNREIIAA